MVRNADRITNPVMARAVLGGVIALIAAFGVDLNLDENQVGALSDLLIVVLPLLGTLAGTIWGTRTAREGVTPIGPDDTPRNADGVELVPGTHVPATGYPRPRVDRRGIDRDPDR
jgi:hypothetical protein